VHAWVELQETLLSDVSADPKGHSMGAARHVVPVQTCATANVRFEALESSSKFDPTAKHIREEGQETSVKGPGASRVITDQTEPFQRSANVLSPISLDPPTATQAVADEHDTE
jgi:hypothetical protein